MADGSDDAILETPRDRIRAELQRHGVSPDLAGLLALRLEQLVGALGAESCEAVFAAALAATGGTKSGADPSAPSALDLDEMQRLMTAFAGELQKLDEALRALSAYLTRLRDQATPVLPAALH
jgi:hypothetical protein